MSYKQYADRDIVELDKAGDYYLRHIIAMTTENLHDKSAIAAELAWRDYQNAELRKEVGRLTDVVIQHLIDEGELRKQLEQKEQEKPYPGRVHDTPRKITPTTEVSGDD